MYCTFEGPLKKRIILISVIFGIYMTMVKSKPNMNYQHGEQKCVLGSLCLLKHQTLCGLDL